MVEDGFARVTIVLATGAPEAVASAAAGQDVETRALRRAASLFERSHWVDADAEWLWLLDGSAVPRPDALRRLLAAADVAETLPAPAPVLLASKVLAPGGSVDDGRVPWYRRGGETDLAMRAARLGLLPVRAGRASSLLVRRGAGAAVGPGRGGLAGPGAAMEWTARLLRDGMGYLAPTSVVEATSPAPWPAQSVGRGGLDDLRVAATMLAGPGWKRREKLWLAAEAAGRAGAAVRARTAGARRR
jgi:hypothetical protein